MSMQTAASGPSQSRPSPTGGLSTTTAIRKIGVQLHDRIDAIVIGASAGGVEALGQLLPALPGNLRAAVMIVQHLPRERPSLLVEIFSSRCPRPVREAQDKEPVESGTVYFAAPDYHLLVDTGPQLSLSVDELVNYSRPAIDVLFESAADVYGQRLLGIILTGANNDGAAGLAAITRRGGVAIAQHPDSAMSSYMPMAAIRHTPDALILTLEQIAELLSMLGNDQAMDQSHARK